MRSVELAKKAITMEDTPRPHRLLTNIYPLFKKYDEAMAEAKKAFEMNPSSSVSQHIYGVTLSIVDRDQEAIPFLEEANRLNPYPASAYFYQLAQTLHNLGKYEEALAPAKKAVRVSPKDPFARQVLVIAYSFLGRNKEARAEASELLKIDPDFTIGRIRKLSPAKNREKVERRLGALAKAGLPEE